jgi:hypothetical protein
MPPRRYRKRSGFSGNSAPISRRSFVTYYLIGSSRPGPKGIGGLQELSRVGSLRGDRLPFPASLISELGGIDHGYRHGNQHN